MEIYGKKVNLKSVSLFLLHFLIFADIIFISVGLLLDLPDDTSFYIILFDLMICIFLLSEWIIRFHRAKSKKEFLKEKENWVTLIASIPFEALFPAVIPGANLLRYIMLFKLLRIMVLYNKFFNGFKKFIKNRPTDDIIPQAMNLCKFIRAESKNIAGRGLPLPAIQGFITEQM